jgi:hypothetical protein
LHGRSYVIGANLLHGAVGDGLARHGPIHDLIAHLIGSAWPCQHVHRTRRNSQISESQIRKIFVFGFEVLGKFVHAHEVQRSTF